MASSSSDKMSMGNTAVLRKLAKGRKFCYRLVTIQPDTRVSMHRGSPQIRLSDMVGHRFGTLFKFGKDRLEPVVDASEFDQFEDHLVSELNSQIPPEENPVSDRDNRHIVDSTLNQALSATELSELKQSGETGRSVIERLIDSSANFEQKTSFSQEKYVRKKKEKYLDYVAALPPSARVLSEIRGKGLNLRFDMVSQLLAYANVHCATRALVVDESRNLLLTLAVCERLHAESGGRVCLLMPNPGRAADALDRLNQRCRQCCSVEVACLPLDCVMPALEERKQAQAQAEASADGEPDPKRARLAAQVEAARRLLAHSDWDCLLVASRFNPVSLIPLCGFLLPGRPFAFHSEHQDALVTLAGELQARRLACAGPLMLFDSFCRPWQLLPGRCRPAMRMEAMGSGFALVGRVSGEGEPEEPAAAAAGDGGDEVMADCDDPGSD